MKANVTCKHSGADRLASSVSKLGLRMGKFYQLQVVAFVAAFFTVVVHAGYVDERTLRSSYISHVSSLLAQPPPLPPARSTVILTGWTNSQQQWYASQGLPMPVPNSLVPGYQNFHGLGKYKVHRRGRTWSDALDVCASEGSILAVINNENQANVIKTLILGATPSGFQVSLSGMYFYWIGAKEFGVNMQFYTLHGEILGDSNYLRWSPSNDQPDNYGNYDCVGIMHDGKNFDAACSEPLGFVCEKVT